MYDWIINVFQSLSVDYSKTINEVLEASRKMEASLLKLQQMRKTKQAGNDGKMTDDEKIRKQIRLDVTEFGERFFKLGVDRENQAYKDLFLLANST